MFKTSLRAALLASAIGGAAMTGAYADEAAKEDEGFPGDFSATLTFTTNYVFRGFTQTQDDPTIQGSFDYTSPWGLYAGVWASGVDFYGAVDDDANLEVDAYFGYRNSIEKFSYDVGAVYYAYPGADDAGAEYNYWEVYGKAGYDFGILSTTASVYYSPEFFAEVGDAIYYNGYVKIPLPFLESIAPYIDGWVGYQTYKDDAIEDYLDYSAGFGFAVEGFNLGFRYTGTDIDEAADPLEVADDKFIFSVGRTF